MTELPGTYLGLVEKLDHLKVNFRELLEKNVILPRDAISIYFQIIFVQLFSECVIIVHWKTIGHMNDKCSILNKYKLSFFWSMSPTKQIFVHSCLS